MNTELSPFDVSAYLAELRANACTLGEPFHYFTTTTSTNDEAKRLASLGAPHGTVCFADYQTNGRGRKGKQWQAQANAQVLTSILLKSPNHSNNATLTLAVGVALHRALQPLLSSDVPLHIKWPNDIEVDGRKLAGVLTESVATADSFIALVGIGLNVWDPPLEGADPLMPVSLNSLSCRVARETLLVQLLRAVALAFASFERSGLSPFIQYINQYDALQGADVSVDGVDGRALGVAPDGALRVATPTGETHVASGTVLRRQPNP